MSLATCVLTSRRLMRVPLPWRDIATSVLIAAASGLTAALASAAMADMAVFFRLAGAGSAGGLMFLALNSLFHPQTTLALAAKLRDRLRAA